MLSHTLLHGECLEQLASIPSAIVHCCVTSPPYWGLRDYGTPDQLGLEATPQEYVAALARARGVRVGSNAERLTGTIRMRTPAISGIEHRSDHE
jgi:hypothetical protein